MDVFDGASFYEKFKYKKTKPINDNFAQLGLRNLVFLINSGSFFIIFSGIIGLIVAKILLH